MSRDVYFDKGLRIWITNTARRELWRMPTWFDVDDLVHEGMICYCKCRDKYALSPPDPGAQPLNTANPTKGQRKHFMALVQTAFHHRITTLANKSTATPESTLDYYPTDDDQLATFDELLPPQQEEVSILLALKQAPAEIVIGIGLLVQDTEIYKRSRLRYCNGRVRLGRRALRETTEERLQRVTGDGKIQEKTIAYLCS